VRPALHSSDSSLTDSNVASPGQTLAPIHPYDSGIVYILPSRASTPFWLERYGYRDAFYSHANLSDYKTDILSDLLIISQRYRFIIHILPLDDTTLYYYNIRLMDSMAAQTHLRIFYAFFPKWKYGAEWNYLTIGSQAHSKMIYDMQYVENLNSTSAIAIWYGWRDHASEVSELRWFYEALPPGLKQRYWIWVDQPFNEGLLKAGLPEFANQFNIGVVTELYDPELLSTRGMIFSRQMVVTGVNGASSTSQWLVTISKRLYQLSHMILLEAFEPRRLGVWIFWDENDGVGEKFSAYINGALMNPVLGRLPTEILVDEFYPDELRVDVGSKQTIGFHFHWLDGYNASNVFVTINSTVTGTDIRGWSTFEVASHTPRKFIWCPVNASWSTSKVEIQDSQAYPSLVFDQVVIELSPKTQQVYVGSNATITEVAFYAYDGVPFKGTVLLNDTTLKDQLGTFYFTVNRVEDQLHNLTSFKSNTVAIVYNAGVNASSSAPFPYAHVAIVTTVLTTLGFLILFAFVYSRHKKNADIDKLADFL
jgi:hypothetical protein